MRWVAAPGGGYWQARGGDAPPLASTPREPKKSARGRICITRQTGCNIRGQPGARQRVSEASKGPQLTLQTSELVSVKQRRDVGGKVIMCLNDRRSQGIW